MPAYASLLSTNWGMIRSHTRKSYSQTVSICTPDPNVPTSKATMVLFAGTACSMLGSAPPESILLTMSAFELRLPSLQGG